MEEQQSRVRDILRTSRRELREKLVALHEGVPAELRQQIENIRRLFTQEWLAADLLMDREQPE